MELKEFVESLPYQAFDELRKVVVVRHSREAAELMKIIMYLRENKTLEDIREANPQELIPNLMEVNQCGPEVCLRALDRFVAIKMQEQESERNDSGTDGNPQLHQKLRDPDQENQS